MNTASSQQIIAIQHLLPVKGWDNAGHASNSSKAVR
jgi:hypothetical protein